MCGIAGIVGTRVERSQLAAMGRAMVHRGPDDDGVYLADDIGLSFRRLAIVDLDGGHQPMANEDGTVQVVFNGEIYDHAQLRKQLLNDGHRFATVNSDTEVLVHGWEEWGNDLFGRLNGMFGVAVWCERSRTLTLARDRYGIKPLYYAPLPDGGLVFASEIRSILASGLIEPEPNPAALREYFTFQNVWREPTMFRGVFQLDPGTILTWTAGRTTRTQYWDVTFPRRRTGSLEQLAGEHREILQRTLKRQIAADVPVNSYLSGGIDSTAIAVGAHRIDPGVTAYSCVFDLDNVGTDRHCDEREFSRQVAAAYDMKRIEMELSQDAMSRCMGHLAESLEDLRMGMSYPVYLIAQRAARDGKVVLSGTGGDEFHGGYVGRYQVLNLPPGYQGGPVKPPRLPFKRRMRNLYYRLRYGNTVQSAGPEAIYRNVLNSLIRPEEQADALTPQFLRETAGYDSQQVVTEFLNRCPSDDWRDRVMYVDAKTYLAGLLTLEDKLSMAHSLETRVPLLDNELIDFVLDVPFDSLWRGETGKVLFRESVRPWVPPEIYRKPKMGFGPPDASWYRGTLRPWIQRTLVDEPGSDCGRGIFRPEYVTRMLHEHFSGTADRTYMIWSLLNFEYWCRAYGFYGATATVDLHKRAA